MSRFDCPWCHDELEPVISARGRVQLVCANCEARSPSALCVTDAVKHLEAGADQLPLSFDLDDIESAMSKIEDAAGEAEAAARSLRYRLEAARRKTA